MRKSMIVAGFTGLMLTLGGCGQSAEKTGESMDNAVENATQGHRNTSDGAMERAGEAVDQAAGQHRQGDAGDALNDATDGNPSTKP
ncbi:MAG TPA: hypothetical protein VG943_01235 [Caulobacterales bacterium]|nr:hypothetical protein [Caulobacterales bacterium]